jgi:hypothetical protein
VDGRLQHVVYRGTDNLVQELWWSPAGGWQVGTLGATAGAAPAAGDPCGYMDGAGNQHVVYRGTDNSIHDLYWTALTGWQAGSLSATPSAAPSAGDPCAFWDVVGHDVVYRGTDNLIHELWLPSTGQWQVGPLSPLMIPAAGDPHCYVTATGQRVVYKGTDNLIHDLEWSAAGGWQVGRLSVTPGAALATGDPSGYSDAGSEHVLYTGVDNLIHDLWSLASGSWQVATASDMPAPAAAAGDLCSAAGHLAYRGIDNLIHDLQLSGSWQPGTLGSAQEAVAAAGEPRGYLLVLDPPLEPNLEPMTLLDFVALQSWKSGGVAPVNGAFSPRGSIVDDPAQPDPTPAGDQELFGAVTYLSGRHGANFSELLGGALDVTSHRIDAWATALATSRLSQLRTAEKKANTTPVTWIGGFGWVENLKARPMLHAADPPVTDEPNALDDPANAGFLQAPSLQQATTAAVLRSGYLTHNPPNGAPPNSNAAFAIDMSSRRARLAGWILDGIRQGQALSALLGYRFERALQEATLGDLIDKFRQVAPYDPAASLNTSGPGESVRATDVVDGVALLRLFQQQLLPPDPMWSQAQGPLKELEEAADAIGDAVLAQAVHDSLSGNTHAAAATFDAMATGIVPAPPLTFLSTPRTGVAIAHRVIVPMPTNVQYPPLGWPDTPRGRCEPALSAWVASLLGVPSQIEAEVSLVDPTGAPLAGPPVSITLDQLGLGPLDVLALSRHPSEFEQLAVHSVLASRQPTAPPSGGGVLLDSPTDAVRPLSAVLAVARSANQLIGASLAADGRDLAPAGTQADPGVDLSELENRIHGPNGLVAALAAVGASLQAALPGDPVPGAAQTTPTGVPAGADPATLASALVEAVLVGIPNTAPAGTGIAALSALVGQSRSALAEIVRRQNAIIALEPAPLPAPPPPLTPTESAAILVSRLAQASVGLGESFHVLPHILTNSLAQASAMTQIGVADAGQGPDAWLVKAGRVHPGVADLLATLCASEALGGPPLELTVAQLPASAAPMPWVGLPFVGMPPSANTLSLTMLGATAPPAGPLSSLLVADWVEVIPSSREITGLAYHYDAPTAQAPQSILLAVPARPSPTTWSYGDLVDTVATALDLAHARAVEFNELDWPIQQILPAAYFPNQGDGLPFVPGSVWQASSPADYLVQHLGPPTITSVDAVQLMQSTDGSIVVRGANFGNLQPSAFRVDGGGVTVTSAAITENVATLAVHVDSLAAPGPRPVIAGSYYFAPTLVVVTLMPQAVSCDALQLSQGMADVNKIVTVAGQFPNGASVSLVGTTQDVSNVLGYSVVISVTQVVIDVVIAASTYDPSLFHDSVYNKLDPPRGPIHVNVPLTLTVTPTGGVARIFHMTLDKIV